MRYRIISGTDFVAVMFEGSTPLQVAGLHDQIERILNDENIEQDEERRCTPLQSAIGGSQDTSPPIEYEEDGDKVGFPKPKG